MGQLLALFISAKRHGSDPAPLGSASNDKRKERAARLLTAAGTSRRLEVGQTVSACPEYLRLPGVAEHSSVMSIVFVSSYLRK
jgi:hypothetical protein